VNVLGIETSCDETAAAVVRDGRTVLSNVVHSQVALHSPYGGVVPEIASRSHVERLPAILERAVAEAGLEWSEVDTVAVTYGPGLAPSLLVGLSAAKALAIRLDRPLCLVNHLEAHLYSIFLDDDAPEPGDVCPYVALLVSGGHTCLVRVEGPGAYTLLGQTIDDAAGEAFDKGATLLGLGYPGGPAIQKASEGGDPDYVRFPRSRQKRHKWPAGALDPELCFSFSGVKTALLYYLRDHPLDGDPAVVASLAASYQEAIVDALVQRCRKVLDRTTCLALVGGVSLNHRLREALSLLAEETGVRLLLARPRYCADNAAMIAGMAGTGAESGIRGKHALMADAAPSLGIG
jgi:N6-L-threonylcarbamoyladenine synthase